MQVFIIGSAFETAFALDIKRLNKQIIECMQILNAIAGAKAWHNHPAVRQYATADGIQWLKCYMKSLKAYARNDMMTAIVNSDLCEIYKPEWHTQEYYDQMKRRLYTKNPDYYRYREWAYLGKSEENWYWSHELQKFIKYVNGKRVK